MASVSFFFVKLIISAMMLRLSQLSLKYKDDCLDNEAIVVLNHILLNDAV
jgi:hypothetical protein